MAAKKGSTVRQFVPTREYTKHKPFRRNPTKIDLQRDLDEDAEALVELKNCEADDE